MKIDKEFVEKVFNKPRVIGIIADISEGKTMTACNLIDSLVKDFKCDIRLHGFRCYPQEVQFHSLEELESFENKIIFIDEFYSLFDLENRKKVKEIETTLRLINHRNNILVLIGTAENFKKFISNKLDMILFKKTTIGECINGSKVKNVLTSYNGPGTGVTALRLNKNECLFYDGLKYNLLEIDYIESKDTKKDNIPLISCEKILCENVSENVESKSKEMKGGINDDKD